MICPISVPVHKLTWSLKDYLQDPNFCAPPISPPVAPPMSHPGRWSHPPDLLSLTVGSWLPPNGQPAHNCAWGCCRAPPQRPSTSACDSMTQDLWELARWSKGDEKHPKPKLLDFSERPEKHNMSVMTFVSLSFPHLREVVLTATLEATPRISPRKTWKNRACKGEKGKESPILKATKRMDYEFWLLIDLSFQTIGIF